MKKLNLVKVVGIFFVFTLLFVFGGVVQAGLVQPVAESSAAFDWSTFQILCYDTGYGTPTVSLSDEYQGVDVEANGTWNSDYSWDWTSVLNVEQTQDGAYGNAWAQSSEIGAYSAVFQGDPSPYAWSDAYREASFSVSGPGLVVFMLDYELNTNINWGPGVLDAWVGSEAWLEIEDENGRYSDSYDWLWDETGYKSGTLSVAMLFDDGGSGYFYSGVYADASAETVPIPSAVVLFAPGLACLIGIRRKIMKR